MSKTRRKKLKTIELSDDEDDFEINPKKDVFDLSTSMSESDVPSEKRITRGKQRTTDTKKFLSVRKTGSSKAKVEKMPCVDFADVELKGFEICSQDIKDMGPAEKKQILEALKASTSIRIEESAEKESSSKEKGMLVDTESDSQEIPFVSTPKRDTGTKLGKKPKINWKKSANDQSEDSDDTTLTDAPVVEATGENKKTHSLVQDQEVAADRLSQNLKQPLEVLAENTTEGDDTFDSVHKLSTDTNSTKESDIEEDISIIEAQVATASTNRSKSESTTACNKKRGPGRKALATRCRRHKGKDPLVQESMKKYMTAQGEVKEDVPNEIYTSDAPSECERKLKKKTRSRIQKTPEVIQETDTNQELFTSDNEPSDDHTYHEFHAGPDDETLECITQMDLPEEEDKCIQASLPSQPIQEGEPKSPSSNSTPAEEVDKCVQVSFTDTDENHREFEAEILSKKGISKQQYMKSLKHLEVTENDSEEDLFNSQPVTGDSNSKQETKAVHKQGADQLEESTSVDLTELFNEKRRNLRKRKAQLNPEAESEGSDGRRFKLQRPKLAMDDNLEGSLLPLSENNKFQLDLSSLPPDEVFNSSQETPENDVPVRKLVNKVKARRRLYDPNPYHAPHRLSKAESERHAMRIKSYFDQYQCLLKDAQSRVSTVIPWGSPIKVGPHKEGTLDYKPVNVTSSNRRNATTISSLFDSIEGDDTSKKPSIQSQSTMTSRATRYMTRNNKIGIRQPYINIQPLDKNVTKSDTILSTAKFYAEDTERDDIEDVGGDFQTLPRLKRKKMSDKTGPSNATYTKADIEDIDTIPETQTFDFDDDDDVKLLIKEGTIGTDGNQNYKGERARKNLNPKQDVEEGSLTKSMISGVTRIGSECKKAASKALQSIQVKGKDLLKSATVSESKLGHTEKEKAESFDLLGEILQSQENTHGHHKSHRNKADTKTDYKKLLDQFAVQSSDNETSVEQTDAKNYRELHLVHTQSGEQFIRYTDDEGTVFIKPLSSITAKERNMLQEISINQAHSSVGNINTENYDISGSSQEISSRHTEQKTIMGTDGKRKSDEQIHHVAQKRTKVGEAQKSKFSVNTSDYVLADVRHTRQGVKSQAIQLQDATFPCPICGEEFNAELINAHTMKCMEEGDTTGQQLEGHAGAGNTEFQQHTMKAEVRPPIRTYSRRSVSKQLKDQWTAEEARKQLLDQDSAEEILDSGDEWIPEIEMKGKKRTIVTEDSDDDYSYDIEDIQDENLNVETRLPARSRGKGQATARRGRAKKGEAGAREMEGKGRDVSGQGSVHSSYERNDMESDQQAIQSVSTQNCFVCNIQIPVAIFEEHMNRCLDKQEEEEKEKQRMREIADTRTRSRRAKKGIAEEMKDFILEDTQDASSQRAGGSGRNKQTHLKSFFEKSTNTSTKSKKSSINTLYIDENNQNNFTVETKSSMLRETKEENSQFSAIEDDLSDTLESDSDQSFVFNKHDISDTENGGSSKNNAICSSSAESSSHSSTFPNVSHIEQEGKFKNTFKKISEQTDGLFDFHNQFKCVENLDEYRASKGTKRKRQQSAKGKKPKKKVRKSTSGRGKKKKKDPPVWIK